MAENNRTENYSDPTYTIDDILNEVRNMKSDPSSMDSEFDVKKVTEEFKTTNLEITPEKASELSFEVKTDAEPVSAPQSEPESIAEVDPLAGLSFEPETEALPEPVEEAPQEDLLKNFFNRSKNHNYQPGSAEARNKADTLFGNEESEADSANPLKKRRAPHALTAEELLNNDMKLPDPPETTEDATIQFDKIQPEEKTAQTADASQTISFNSVNLNDLLKPQNPPKTEEAPPVRAFNPAKILTVPEEDPFSGEPDEDWEYEEIDDYHSIEDAEDVRVDLESRRSTLRLRFFFTLIFGLLSGALSLLPYYMDFPEFISPSSSPVAFLSANVVCLTAVILCNFRSVFRGCFNLFRLKSDIDTAAGIAAFACLAQLIVLYWNQDAVMSGSVFIYPSLAALALLFNLLGKMSMISRIRSNFDLVSNSNIKQSVFLVEEPSSETLQEGESGRICCDKSVINLQNYLYHSFGQDPADSMCKTLAPVGLIAALVCGVIVYYTAGDFVLALSALAAVCCVCVPLTSMLASNLPLRSACKRLKEYGAMLPGYSAVNEFHDVDSIVVDAEELFPAGSVDLVSMKSFGDVAIDRVILDAAAVAISAGGPLSDVFDKMIEGRRKLLPKTELVSYFDNQGICGQVSGQTIRIGTRSFMDENNITGLPDAEFNKRILRGGNHPVYISLENQLIGMFILHYNVIDEDALTAVERMIRQGVTLLVKTTDANITAALIEERYEIPSGSVKILTGASTKAYDELTAPETDGDGLLAHNNNITAFSAAITACKRLRGNIFFATILQTIGVILGFGAVFYLVLTESFSYLAPQFIAVYQLIVTILVLILPKFRRV